MVGVTVSSESFDLSGEAIEDDEAFPVLQYSSGDGIQQVLEFQRDNTFLHMSGDGLEMSSLGDADRNCEYCSSVTHLLIAEHNVLLLLLILL